MQTFYQIHSTDVTIGDCGGAHVLGVTTTDALCRLEVGAWKLVELFQMRFAPQAPGTTHGIAHLAFSRGSFFLPSAMVSFRAFSRYKYCDVH
jgi:hypothetical protein